MSPSLKRVAVFMRVSAMLTICIGIFAFMPFLFTAASDVYAQEAAKTSPQDDKGGVLGLLGGLSGEKPAETPSATQPTQTKPYTFDGDVYIVDRDPKALHKVIKVVSANTILLDSGEMVRMIGVELTEEDAERAFRLVRGLLEGKEVRLELKLIADVGFVGLPNAGKSSMLNELTNAKSKVANYPFTTLEPNLGAYYELILADIPGIIEGSSSGRGLGIKFLRHIERTRILFHFISTESSAPEKDYETIRKELGSYNKALLEKPEYLFLTKSDLVEEKTLKEKLAVLKKINKNVMAVSIIDPESMKKIQKILNGIKDEKIKHAP